MKLRCECGAQVEAKNVNVAAAIASCLACGAVFSIDQSKSSEHAAPPRVIPTSITPRESLRGEAHPGAYREASAGEGARWTLRWFRPLYALMVLFFIFWDAVCGSFVVVGLSGGAFGLFTLLLPHVWIGVFGSYWVLAHLFNRTTFTLSDVRRAEELEEQRPGAVSAARDRQRKASFACAWCHHRRRSALSRGGAQS